MGERGRGRGESAVSIELNKSLEKVFKKCDNGFARIALLNFQARSVDCFEISVTSGVYAIFMCSIN